MPITLDGTVGITTPMYNGAVASNQVTPSVNMKNRIINGAMVIDQRNAGASVSVNNGTANFFAVDRWFGNGVNTAGVFSLQQSSTAPSGFRNSLIATTTTTDSSPASSSAYIFRQRIEGFNTADLMWGTSTAQTVTLSFWVRSSLTGTFGGSLFNSNGDRIYVFSYTISSANTWEQKTVTIAGDTTGTWVGATNGTGLNVVFCLGAGSANLGTAGSWGSSFYFGPTGQTNILGTNGATLYITGVQLEVGSSATSFDYRPYGTELALCQRYFYTSYPSGNAVGSITFTNTRFSSCLDNTSPTRSWVQNSSYPNQRATPTVTFYNPGTGGSNSIREYSSSANLTVSSPPANRGESTLGDYMVLSTNQTISNPAFFHFTASSEL